MRLFNHQAISNRRERHPQDRSITRDEAFRVLRSNLRVAISDLDNPIVLVTSAVAGEGKTSTCVTLAESLADSGLQVVLVDLDLRDPDAHRSLGADIGPGVSEVLQGQAQIAEALQFIETEPDRGFYFLPTGAQVDNPAELLGSDRAHQLLVALAAQAQIVLIDAPPVLPVADTLIVGRYAAGVLLVVEARRTPSTAVNKAKDALTRNQTRILGVVINKLQSRDVGDDYGFDFQYGYHGRESK